MKKSRVTISDLARHVDLSLCTVSKILNRSFEGFTYAPGTIARVEAAAKELGYRPNPQAQSLRTRRSNLIGLVLPTAEIAFYGTFTDRLELELRRRGYQVLIAHTRRNARAEMELVPELLARGVDGLVWVPVAANIDLKQFGLRADFPAVIVDRSGCTPAIPCVVTENREATRDLAQRVYAMGHRRAGVLNEPASDRSMHERFKGIQDVFGDKIVLGTCVNEPAAARGATLELLQAGHNLSALFALSEPLAIGALSALRQLQLKIPDDLSFAAFDDFPLAEQWLPPVTVIRPDIAELASATADLVVRRINSPRAACEPVRVAASIEWRGSIIATSPASASMRSRT